MTKLEYERQASAFAEYINGCGLLDFPEWIYEVEGGQALAYQARCLFDDLMGDGILEL